MIDHRRKHKDGCAGHCADDCGYSGEDSFGKQRGKRTGQHKQHQHHYACHDREDIDPAELSGKLRFAVPGEPGPPGVFQHQEIDQDHIEAEAYGCACRNQPQIPEGDRPDRGARNARDEHVERAAEGADQQGKAALAPAVILRIHRQGPDGSKAASLPGKHGSRQHAEPAGKARCRQGQRHRAEQGLHSPHRKRRLAEEIVLAQEKRRHNQQRPQKAHGKSVDQVGRISPGALRLIPRQRPHRAALFPSAQRFPRDSPVSGAGTAHRQRGIKVERFYRKQGKHKQQGRNGNRAEQSGDGSLKHKPAHQGNIREYRGNSREKSQGSCRRPLRIILVQPVAEENIAEHEQKGKDAAQRHGDIPVADEAEHAENDDHQQRRGTDPGNRDENAGKHGPDEKGRSGLRADAIAQADPVQHDQRKDDRKRGCGGDLRHDDLSRRKRHGQKLLEVVSGVQHRHQILDREHKAHNEQQQHQRLRKAL